MTLEHAGVVVLWSDDRPRFATYQLHQMLTLGRELLEVMLGGTSDDRISRRHARIDLHPDGERLILRDAGSRNGTYVQGARLEEERWLHPPFVVRTGRTIWLVVKDLRPYEGVRLERRGRLVVGATMRPIWNAVDAVARTETNLLLTGSTHAGRGLAAGYVERIGGPVARFNAKHAGTLERALEGKPRILELVIPVGERLATSDVEALASWLETDLRVVTVLGRGPLPSELPPEIVARLSRATIEVPDVRYDEVATTVADAMRDLAPQARIHPTAIELCLVHCAEMSLDSILHDVRDSVLRWRTRGHDTIRYRDLVLLNFAEVVAMAVPPPVPAPTVEDEARAERPLCRDGTCLGSLAIDGRCTSCGAPGSRDAAPYR